MPRRHRMGPVLAALAALAAAGAQAETLLPAPETLPLPAEWQQTLKIEEPIGDYALPVAAFGGADPATAMLTGHTIWRSFRVEQPRITVAETMAPFRRILQDRGFEILLDCVNRACGGLAFRFGAKLLRAPEMLFDAGDFAQISARREGNPELYHSVLVSRVLGDMYVQTVAVAVAGSAEPAQADAGSSDLGASIPEALAALPASVPVPPSPDAGDLLGRLRRDGHVRVEGLVFESGGTDLSAGSAEALDRLAAMFAAAPEISAVIVGHSDNQGALALNIELSRRRAAAVMQALTARGVAAARLGAEGVGYLAPMASHTTEAGRARNRRVELVLR